MWRFVWPAVDLWAANMWPNFSLTFRRCVTSNAAGQRGSVVALWADSWTLHTRKHGRCSSESVSKALTLYTVDYGSVCVCFCVCVSHTGGPSVLQTDSSWTNSLTTSLTDCFTVFTETQSAVCQEVEVEVATSGFQVWTETKHQAGQEGVKVGLEKMIF